MNFYTALVHGTADPLLLIAAALVLGAVHGLEPGHSKTMIAAFIIAVRGSVIQAVILGISAMLSHTVIVWVLSLLALTYGDKVVAAQLEPWFMMASGVFVISLGAWMFSRVRRSRQSSHVNPHNHQHPHSHENSHHHTHTHGHQYHTGHDHPHPHTHTHDHDHDHENDHLDAHARAHARDIEQKFSSGRANTAQVIWFGLSGGLVPCPASITVLLICLNIQRFWLGVAMVGAFSLGLAFTLVAVGVITAWGLSLVRRKFSKLDSLFAWAPYVSSILVGVMGIIMLIMGYNHFDTVVQ